MARQISLSVNDSPIPVDYFVEGFIDHVVGGMLAALEGTGEIETLDLSIEEDGQVIIILNNDRVPIKPFVIEIIRSTIVGMVSPLKGVSGVKTLKLAITR